ncbi:MAG TPA: hypothetical protein VEI06_06025 [Gemmatimonadaceae bacterium]|nr:hypothetical protein [Gemmatimonadaceae bacterium]
MANSTAAETRVQTPGTTIQVDWAAEHNIVANTIPAPADKVWKYLPETYTELGIDPGTVDSEHFVYGNTSARVRRQIGGVRISKYLECGSQAGTPTADVYDIYISVLTKVEPGDAGTSTVKTQVEGQALPEGVSGHNVRCATTGALEARIAKMLNDRMAHSPT